MDLVSGTKRLKRTGDVLSFGARVLLGEAVATITKSDDTDAARRRFTAYASRLGRMRGAVMKIGQLLSFYELGFVEEPYASLYKEVFAILNSEAPAMPAEEARAAALRDRGPRFFEQFQHFDDTPVASASLGQVHRGVLLDGTPVAVKIQYPGVAEAVGSDLRNGELLFQLLALGRGAIGGNLANLDVNSLFEELADRVAEELDYRLEAERTRRFAELYEGHPFIRVPGVVDELSGERVLTMTLGEGLPWKQALEADQSLKDIWGETVYRMTMTSLFDHGIINADPNPGNFLFGEDGSVTFLDFGCVKHYTAPFVAVLRGMAECAMTGDGDGLYEVMSEAGFIDPASGLDGDVLIEWVRPNYMPLVHDEPFTFTKEYAGDVMRNSFMPDGSVRPVAGKVLMPADYLMMQRVVIGLYSLLANLNATANWRAVQEETWGAPPRTERGRVDAAWRAQRA